MDMHGPDIAPECRPMSMPGPSWQQGMAVMGMPGMAAHEAPSGMAIAALLIQVPRRNMASKASRGKCRRILCMSASGDLD
jgi:hypothetical protein